ncbi:hypothetical protein LTR95_006908 [Oleoguttula sp. CCFEE 5521]
MSTDRKMCVEVVENEDMGKTKMKVESWIMNEDNRMNVVTDRTVMLKNIVLMDDLLVVVCPKCMIARVAARTQRGLEEFVELIETEGESSMTASYCAMVTDLCLYASENVHNHAHMFIHEFEASEVCTMLAEMMNGTTYISSENDKREIMLLSSDEIKTMCSTMHRIPLKFDKWDIIMPVTDDQWTKMD